MIQSNTIPVGEKTKVTDLEGEEPILNEVLNQPDVVIVGAGPVGLWIGIMLKYKKPFEKVLVYERYQEYQRKNMIKLCKPDKLDIPKDMPRLKKMFENKVISIMEIENILKQEARARGVQIVYKKVEDFDSLYEKFPKAKLWIGADGAHSQLREKWFGLEVHEPICNIVQVSFETEKNPEGFNMWKKYALMKKIDCLAEETTNGKKVTIRFTVKDALYESVKDHRAKNPLKSLDEVTNKELHHMIEFWIKSRAFYLGEKWLPETLSIHAFQLDSYRSQGYCHQNKHGLHALCGDSAFGVPFYRSMRNGWIAANNLVKTYVSEGRFIEKYQEFMRYFYDAEQKRANRKASKVGFAEKFVKLSASVPWQVNKVWDLSYKKIMKKEI